MQRREAEILDHPVGKTKTMVEVVEINLGGEDSVVRRSLKLAEEIRSGEMHLFWLVKDGVGRSRVNDKAQRFGDGKKTIDDVNRGFKSDHVKLLKTMNEAYVLLPRRTED